MFVHRDRSARNYRGECFLLQVAEYPAGIPCGDAAGGDVTGYDAAGSDGRPVPDTHTGQENTSSSDPNVFPDVYRSGQRSPERAVP